MPKRIRIVANGKHMMLTPEQILLARQLRELGQRPEFEFQFEPKRRWHSDIYLPEHRILIECDGGKWSGGHKRGQALEDDYEKQNWAQMMGYRILRFTNEQINSEEAKKWLEGWF